MNAAPPTSAARNTRTDVSAHLMHLEDQLDTLRIQVRQAQQLAGLGVAAATIAHEVNNLLTPIIAYGEAAMERDDDKLREKAIKISVQNARMLVAMSDRVLQVSAAHRAHTVATPVREAAEAAAQSLGRDLAKDGITFSNTIDESMIAWIDSLHLQQVLFNLFLNARDAMAKMHGGRLTLSACLDGERVRIDVKDTGGGIDPEELPHIFDALHSTKTANDGEKERCRGLGLALCHDLIQENGGTICVTTRVGQSTTFSIFLPAENPDAQP